ncbi:MAG: tetratricopeptide repeat protein [Chloroflexia bacterium]|nr:tetratricopeptide repeat protein [Chloroflexia bacterium]
MEKLIHHLVPSFILEKYAQGESGGHIQATTMFVDISGFTPLTEALMRHGDEGAEILSSILNQIFDPAVEAIHHHGGFISTFAGDAFTTILPQARPALACAEAIRAIFERHGNPRTRFGDFGLRVKIGLACGEVEWGIVGQVEKAYFFRGPAIDACAQAEQRAGQGEIVVDADLAKRAELAPGKLSELDKGYFLWAGTIGPVSLPPPEPHPPPSREVLTRFLPDSVLDFERTGEFRNVAPVFISFSAVADLAELDTFVSILIEQGQRFGGYLNKIDFGDKGSVALCLFGAPTAFEDNVKRASDFCLAVRRELAIREDFSALQWRAGISYGTVYAGIVGGRQRCEYTAIGDRVNLAARLMARAGWGKVWTDERVYHHGHQQYRLALIGRVSLKGKAEPSLVYRLEGKKGLAEQAFAGPFVGREEELARAGRSFEALSEGRFGGILYVYGEAGVGKSRLVHELGQRYPQFNWLTLPCDRILRKSLNPFAHLFSHFFDQSSEQDPAQNRARFEAAYQELIESLDHSEVPAGPGLRTELVRLRSVMAGFLGLYEQDSLYEQLDPKLRHQNTLYALEAALKALSLSRPLVLQLEDIQWIDADSVQALQILCQNVADLPLLLVAAGRYLEDGSKPRLPLPGPAVELDLNTLGPDSIQALAEALLPGPASRRLLQNLGERTQGNPFFIEQTLRYFQETGIVAWVEGAETGAQVWDIVGTEVALPPTINDLLIARVDRLSTQLKEVVQTAAVLGKEFEVRLLTEVLRRMASSLPLEEMDLYLHEGTERHLWTVLSELRYIFSHALLQDAVYRMQLKARLRRLHHLAAQAIEKLFPEDKRAYADLAFHYDRAEDREKAVEYLQRAGDFAREHYAADMAVRHYQRALELLAPPRGSTPTDGTPAHAETLVRQVAVHEGLVRALSWQARFTEATESCQTMLAVAKESGDYVLQSRAWQTYAETQHLQGNHHQALSSAQRAGELAQAAGAKLELLKALHVQCFSCYSLGKPEAALPLGEQALALGQELKNKKDLVGVLWSIAGAHWLLGNYRQATHYNEQALALSRELGNRTGESTCLNNLGANAYKCGDYAQALELFQQALTISREIGFRQGELMFLNNLGGTQVELGRYRAAEENLREVIRLVGDKGWFERAVTYRFLAGALLGQGRLEEALESARHSLALAQELNRQQHIGESWRMLGTVLAQFPAAITPKETPYTAAECFAASRQIFGQSGMEGELARTLSEWAKYEMVRGDREKGESMWKEAREIFEHLGLDLEVARMQRWTKP